MALEHRERPGSVDFIAVIDEGFCCRNFFRLIGRGNRGKKKTHTGSLGAVVSLLLLVAYLGMRADLHSRAIELLLAREYHDREPIAAGAFPSSSNPFDWRGVVLTNATAEELDVPLGPNADFDPDAGLTHYKPQESAALDVAQSTAAAQVFLAYTRFPLVNVTRREDDEPR